MVNHAAALGLVAVALVATPVLAAPASVDKDYSATFNACMDAAGGSTMPMLDCIDTEHQAWDTRLNATYQALMAVRSDAARLELRDDERAWIKRRQATCDHAGDDEAGGSLQKVEVDQCYLDETIRRTLYLNTLR